MHALSSFNYFKTRFQSVVISGGMPWDDKRLIKPSLDTMRPSSKFSRNKSEKDNKGQAQPRVQYLTSKILTSLVSFRENAGGSEFLVETQLFFILHYHLLITK